jgi:hypothetical protein
MLQMTLYLTWSSCLWTFQLLGLEMFQVRLQKKSYFNRFYRDRQRRNFRRLEDKNLCRSKISVQIYYMFFIYYIVFYLGRNISVKLFKSNCTNKIMLNSNETLQYIFTVFTHHIIFFTTIMYYTITV